MINQIPHRTQILLFSILFALSGFSRYSNEFTIVAIKYPFPLSYFIDDNRYLVAIITSIFIALYRFKIILKLYKYYFYLPIILIHLMLAGKMFLIANNLWYFNLVGALFLGIYIGILTKIAPLFSEFRTVEITFFLIIGIWIVSVLLLFLLGSWENFQQNGRFFFFSAHPNHAGSLWTFSAVSCFFFLINGQTLTRAILMVFFVFSVFLLYLTGSRGAMLSCGAGLLFIIIQSVKSKKRYLYFFLIFVIAASLLYLSSDANQYLANQVARGNTRNETYASAMKGFVDFPLMGIPILSGRPIYVENAFLAFMQLGGSIGLLLAVLFYFHTAQLIYRAYKLYRKTGNRNICYFSSILVTFIIASIFEAFPLNFISIGAFATATSIVLLVWTMNRMKINNSCAS